MLAAEYGAGIVRSSSSSSRQQRSWHAESGTMCGSVGSLTVAFLVKQGERGISGVRTQDQSHLIQ